MLGAIILKLESAKKGSLKKSHGRFNHAAFFDLLNSLDAELARAAHDREEKNFSLSLLWPVPKDNKAFFPILPGKAYYLRIASWDKALLELLMRIPQGEQLRIDQITFTITEVFLGNDPFGKSGLIDEEELISIISNHGPIKEMTFTFTSPTNFHVNGRDYTLPEPKMIFGSLANKWNTLYASFALDPYEIREVARRIYLTEWKGSSESLNYGAKRVIKAFRGSFTYAVNDLSLEEQQTFLLLAQFAVFSGVGRMATQGLGQVDITYR